MRRWGMVVVATAIGFAGLAGCGGGDEEAIPDTVADYVPPEGITVDEWRDQMGAVCADFGARFQRFADAPEPGSVDEAVALLDEALPLVDGFVAGLAAVPPPAGRMRDLEQLQLDIEEMRAVLARADAAAAGRDLRVLYAMLRDLNRQFAVLEQRLNDLGATDCVG